MNKIRKRITFLILIFVSFALMADGCEDENLVVALVGAPAATQGAIDSKATAAYRATAEAADRATGVANYQTEIAKATNTPSPTATPTATAIPTPTPTPQPVTTRVKVGEVAKFETFNVSVTKAQYEAPNPKGALFITVALENKTSSHLSYSAKNFSVTSSSGPLKLLVLPKSSGATWTDDFLANSSVPPNDKATLQFLAEHLGEKEFLLAVVFYQFKAEVDLGR